MYPQISNEISTALFAVAKALELNPRYLESDECPYSESLKAAFVALRGAGAAKEQDLFENGSDLDVIERELKELLSKMKAFGDKLEGLDANEKIQYFKASTGLWEKLISMQERVLNLKKLSEFQTIILEMIGEISPEVRDDLIKRLENAIS